MLRIAQIEELRELLLEVSPLVTAFQRRESGAVRLTMSWLERVEEALTRNRLAEAAAVASLRGGLLQPGRVAMAAGGSMARRPSRRRQAEAAALSALQEAQAALSEVLSGPLAQLEEARRLLAQVLARAAHRGLLTQPSPGEGHTGWLQRLWASLLVDGEVGAACAQVSGLCARHDALVLLDQGTVSE